MTRMNYMVVLRASLLVILLVPLWAEARNGPNSKRPSGVLDVRVSGLPSDAGVVRVALFASEDSFPKRGRAFRNAIVRPIGKIGAVIFKNIPYGIYAVALYHDENENNAFDRSWFGLPLEKYGFSNNARTMLKPPKFKKVRFVVDGQHKVIEIKVRRAG